MAPLRHLVANCSTRFVARPGDRRPPLRVVVVGLGLLGGGCSVSFPMAGLTGDATPTGSIGRPSALLSPALEPEDWRRAKAALAVALDPQGNGAGVAWSNPQTGASGSFEALAPPFIDNDRMCRSFRARVVASAAPRRERRLAGSACRTGEGEWTLRDVKDQKTS